MMRKDISPDQYNYNKYPGPQFVSVKEQVKSEEFSFVLIQNEKDAFDATVFSQKFSEILLKYDYIVGDWGNEQLRLKGFYLDERPVKRYTKISHLEDYLKEYCNFGCAYFVLENPNPQEIKFEEEKLPPLRKKKRNDRKRQQQNQSKRQDKNRQKNNKKRYKDKGRRDKTAQVNEQTDAKQHFVVRKKSTKKKK